MTKIQNNKLWNFLKIFSLLVDMYNECLSLGIVPGTL